MYLCVAIGVTFLSIKAADYVDWIDKKTCLSGAFIGGVMLSAVTSLPELLTSFSSTLLLNLGKGIAGALFMGIATSLPEVTSSIALFRKKKYDIAVGNIIGSNIFKLGILALTDIIYVKGGVYDFSDPKTVMLLVFGAIATPLLFVATKNNTKWLKMISVVGVFSCYLGFVAL